MSRKVIGILAFWFIINMSVAAHATLVQIGTATFNNGSTNVTSNLIYDDVSSVAWLDYTNQALGFQSQQLWADGLNMNYTINPNYIVNWGAENWRLGSVSELDGLWQSLRTEYWDYFVASGYTQTLPNNPIGAFAGFNNLISGGNYWSCGDTPSSNNCPSISPYPYTHGETGYVMNMYPFGPPTGSDWASFLLDGSEHALGLAVHSVHVTAAPPVPEPATMFLLGTGLAGLAGSRIRRKKKA